MARIRTVKPGLFRNVELYEAELSANEQRQGPYLNLRFAFAGLFTVADREGRFKWDPRVLKLDCLPHDLIEFTEVLEALRTSGTPPFIARYEVASVLYGVITGFLLHQRPNHKEVGSELPEPPNAITRASPGQPGQARGEQEQEGKGTRSTDSGPKAGGGLIHNGGKAGDNLLEMRMPWGKEYRGVTIINLPAEYAEWCLSPDNKRRSSIGAQLGKALKMRVDMRDAELMPGVLKQRRKA